MEMYGLRLIWLCRSLSLFFFLKKKYEWIIRFHKMLRVEYTGWTSTRVSQPVLPDACRSLRRSSERDLHLLIYIVRSDVQGTLASQ